METMDAVAQRQHGLLTRRQAIELLGSGKFRRSVSDHHLEAVGHGVYRLVGTVPTFRQRAMAACLTYGPPVAVSHRSAAVLWGCEAVAPGPEIEVSIPHARSGRRHGVRAHRVAFCAADMTERFGIPVTGPARTLLDLVATVAPAVLERCVDDLLRTRQAGAAQLMEWLDRRGHAGATRLRQVLERRAASGVGDSVAVDRVYRWLVRAGLPAPVLGLFVVVGGRLRLLDLAYPVEKVAIEFNGWEFHQMRSRMDADHARTSELQLAGWLVIVVTAAHDEADTVAWVRRALRRHTNDPARHGSGMLDR